MNGLAAGYNRLLLGYYLVPIEDRKFKMKFVSQIVHLMTYQKESILDLYIHDLDLYIHDLDLYIHDLDLYIHDLDLYIHDLDLYIHD